MVTGMKQNNLCLTSVYSGFVKHNSNKWKYFSFMTCFSRSGREKDYGIIKQNPNWHFVAPWAFMTPEYYEASRACLGIEKHGCFHPKKQYHACPWAECGVAAQLNCSELGWAAMPDCACGQVWRCYWRKACFPNPTKPFTNYKEYSTLICRWRWA